MDRRRTPPPGRPVPRRSDREASRGGDHDRCTATAVALGGDPLGVDLGTVAKDLERRQYVVRTRREAVERLVGDRRCDGARPERIHDADGEAFGHEGLCMLFVVGAHAEAARNDDHRRKRFVARGNEQFGVDHNVAGTPGTGDRLVVVPGVGAGNEQVLPSHPRRRRPPRRDTSLISLRPWMDLPVAQQLMHAPMGTVTARDLCPSQGRDHGSEPACRAPGGDHQQMFRVRERGVLSVALSPTIAALPQSAHSARQIRACSKMYSLMSPLDQPAAEKWERS